MKGRYILGLSSLLALVVLAPVSIRAGQTEPLARFTFSEPVSVPGVTLPPGEYLFQLLDPVSSRDIVQVLDIERRQTPGIFRTRLVQRPTISSETQVAFGEAPLGAARPIRVLWFAGSTEGRELIYASGEPGAREARTARANGD